MEEKKRKDGRSIVNFDRKGGRMENRGKGREIKEEGAAREKVEN